MTNTEVIERIKAYLAAMPSDVCEEVESRTYNAAGWPEAPAPLRTRYGYRWWPQIVLAMHGCTKIATREHIERITDSEDDAPLLLDSTVHLVPIHSCGNPRCVNPAHVLNPSTQAAAVAQALETHGRKVEWVGHGAESKHQYVKPRTESHKASVEYAVPRVTDSADLTELVQRCKDDPSHKNRTALLNETYRNFYRSTLWMAGSMFEGREHLADEAVQEAMLALWEKLVAGELPDDPQSYPLWVKTVLRNGVGMYRRREEVRDKPGGKRLLYASDLEAVDEGGGDDGVSTDNWTPPLEQAQFDAGLFYQSAENEAIQEEIEAQIAAFLSTQSPEVQQLYAETLIGNTSVAAFAKSAGKSRATAFRMARKLESDLRFVITGEKVATTEEREELPDPRKAYDAPAKALSERIRTKFRAAELREKRLKEARELAERGEEWELVKSAVTTNDEER